MSVRSCLDCPRLIPTTRSRCKPCGKAYQLRRRGIRSGWEWTEIRRQVIERDGHACVECGFTDGLAVDHIIAREVGGSNELDNLRTLCKECHRDRHH